MIMNQGLRKTLIIDIKQKIEVALVVATYKQAKLSFLASWVCATVSLIYLYYFNSSPLSYIYAWYALFLIITLSRTLLVSLFLQTEPSSHTIGLWKNLFIAGAFLSGICWGITGTPLLLPYATPEQTPIIIILAGVCAGSVPAFSPIRNAALVFLAAALLPLIICFTTTQTSINLFLVLTFSAFFIFLIMLTIKTHKMIRNSFQLQFENETLVISLSDAKSRLELANSQLKQDATHDPLTHVANRSLFEAYFEDSIKTAANEHSILALLYLDLDGFKNVNDTYGHEAGDQLLLIVVARLKNVLRDKDILSRLGGDELAILLENMENVQSIADVAERVREMISEPIMLKDVSVQIHVSIGIALYPTDGIEASILLRVADRAMYYVKDHGGNNYHFNVDVEKPKS